MESIRQYDRLVELTGAGRAQASFLEVPPAELADSLEVGDELPVLRWATRSDLDAPRIRF